MLRGAERTGVAETRIITLPDGSRVQLNARSAIAVDYAHDARRVSLLRGEAFFNVAPDASRPFSVSAGDGVVTALGTAFDVATEAGRTEVTVTEHRVRISGGGPNVLVDAGSQTAFGPGVAAAPPYPVDIDEVTAWRRGKLIFEDRPLAEVMAALGKYHRGVFLILGEAARKRRVTGVFEASDPIGAVRIIERSLGLSAIFLSDYVVVLRG
jgi:transmembrane sensor